MAGHIKTAASKMLSTQHPALRRMQIDNHTNNNATNAIISYNGSMLKFTTVILTILIALPAWGGTRLTFPIFDDELSHVGFAVLQEAYGRIGINVESIPMPVGRSLVESDQGRLDGEIIRIKAIESQHPNLIRIPVAICELNAYAVSCGQKIGVTGWDSLTNKRIGIETGVRYLEMNTKRMPYVTSMQDINRLFDLLKMERIDVIVTEKENILRQQQRPGFDCLTIHGLPLTIVPLYHYLHKSHVDIVQELTAVLEDMRRHGEIKRIGEAASKAYSKGTK